MTDATPYVIPAEPGRWRALALALGMHALLVALLWFSVSWQSATPAAVEAEIWSPTPLEAAPVAPPQPEPETQVEPEVPPPPPKPVEAEQPKIDPDIALRAEKKRKEEELRRKEEEREEKRLEKLKQEREKKEKEKKEAEAKKKAEEKKKADSKAEQARLDKIRKAEMDRMLAQAGTGGSGAAAKSSGTTDGGYGAKVAAKVKANTVFAVPEGLSGNPTVEYEINLFPDGSLRGPIKKLKSSGVPGFDEAVAKAIDKSQPFPPDKNGKVPTPQVIAHKPKD